MTVLNLACCPSLIINFPQQPPRTYSLYEYFASKFAYHNCELLAYLTTCNSPHVSLFHLISFGAASASLCAAFNQLVVWRWRLSARLFSLLSLAFYLRAPSWNPDWLTVCHSESVSHSQSQSVSQSSSQSSQSERRIPPLSWLCLPCGKANVKVDSAVAVCRGLRHPFGFVLHSKWIIIELSLRCNLVLTH